MAFKYILLATALLYLVQAQPIQKLKLRFKLSARGLPDKDKLGTTDPYVEIFYTENGSDKEKRVGRSATISDQENPNWGDIFEFDYDRSRGQRWHFKVRDHDNAREDDTVGKAWVIVDDYVDKGQTYTVNLHKKGTLTVQSVDPVTPPVVPGVQYAVQPVPVVQPVAAAGQPGVVAPPSVAYAVNPVPVAPLAQKLRFQISLRGLEDLDVIGTTDPYIKLYYTEDSKTLDTLIGRTKVEDDNENPDFKEVFDFQYVPGKRQKFHFVVLDDDSNRRDDEAGEAFVDVDEYVTKGENIVANLSKKGQLILKRA